MNTGAIKYTIEGLAKNQFLRFGLHTNGPTADGKENEAWFEGFTRGLRDKNLCGWYNLKYIKMLS